MEGKRVAIIGSGGFAREVLWLIREYNSHCMIGKGHKPLDIAGFITNDTEMHGKTVCDIPVLGADNWLLKNRDVYSVCGIGNPSRRIKVVSFLEEKGIKFVTVIHPSVEMSKFVKIGIGCVICAGTIITTQVKIGNHVHINLNTTTGHDVIIYDFVTISPGVNVSGGVDIGYGAFLGTNSSVLEGLKIGKGSIIGAGSVVTKDVPDNTTVVGIPAKPIKNNKG